MSSNVKISTRRGFDGSYRVTWRHAMGETQAFYASSFDDALVIARTMERDWRATVKEVRRDLGN